MSGDRRPDIGFVLRFRKCPKCDRLWAYVRVVGLGGTIDVDLRAFCDCGMGLDETGTIGRIDIQRGHVATLGAMLKASGPEWADEIAKALVQKYAPQLQQHGLVPDGVTLHPTFFKDVRAPLAKALVSASKVLAERASAESADA